MNNNESHIAENVLARIREGSVRMRSRTYFVICIGAAAIIAVLSLAVSVWVVSFIFFSIHESGELFLLGFGARGIETFLYLFPWLALIIDIGLLCLLEIFLQGFKFGYRTSLLSIFLGILCFSVALGVVFDLLPVHSALLERADRGELPVLGEMYEGIRDSHENQGIFRGTIMSIRTNQIIIAHTDGDHDADYGTWTIVLPENGAPPLAIGDRVYVLGSLNGQTVQAYGVQKLSPDQ